MIFWPNTCIFLCGWLKKIWVVKVFESSSLNQAVLVSLLWEIIVVTLCRARTHNHWFERQTPKPLGFYHSLLFHLEERYVTFILVIGAIVFTFDYFLTLNVRSKSLEPFKCTAIFFWKLIINVFILTWTLTHLLRRIYMSFKCDIIFKYAWKSYNLLFGKMFRNNLKHYTLL